MAMEFVKTIEYNTLISPKLFKSMFQITKSYSEF